MKRIVKISIIILVILALIYFGLSFVVAHLLTTKMSPKLDVTPKLVSENYEDISFKSSDGLNLSGWWFKTSSDKLIIMVTGLLPNRVNTEYYGMWIAKDLVDEGYNVIMYDTRAHGKSEGERVSYGRFEGNDILGAVDFANANGFSSEDIGIIADSTGAVSTLMVSDQLKDVGALVIDTANTNFKPIIINRLWVERKVPPFLSFGIFFFTDTVFGLNISEVRPIEKLPLVPERRFLILHGNLDETFPIEEAEELLAAANKESKLVVFPNGQHIETFKSDPDLYRKEVLDFLMSEIGN